MGLTFNKKYFSVALLIFTIEVLIALFVRDKFVRPYLGDVLVVILIYCFVRSFLSAPPLMISVAVLVFAFALEFLQLFNIVDILGFGNSTVARTVIGTSFAWIDLLAYVAGIAIVLRFEKYLLETRENRT
jgi:hypothetical protein